MHAATSSRPAAAMVRPPIPFHPHRHPHRHPPPTTAPIPGASPAHASHLRANEGPWARGFTLIELLIVMLISLMLCLLAWPRFEAQLHKARRSEAQTALTSLLHAQARYRSNHRHYARSLAELNTVAPSLRHYELRLRGLPASDAGGADDDPFRQGFVATATPLLGSTQSRDAPCAELRLTLDGQQVFQTATDRAGSATDACWPQ